MSVVAPELSVLERTRSKRVHRLIMLACGGWMLLSGAAAAYLAYSSSGHLSIWMAPLGRWRPPAFSRYHLPSPSAQSRFTPSALSRGKEVQPTITWKPWGEEAMSEAEASQRLILLHVTASWSHSCHLMEELTYADPTVAAWLRQNVIAVRVDVDKRPDIAQRYVAAGLPTTAIVLPTGEVLSESNFIPPERFLPWAKQIVRAYRHNPEAIWAQREASRRRAIELQKRKKVSASAMPWTRAQASEIVETQMRALIQQFDRTHGGFGRGRKTPMPEALIFLLEYHAITKNKTASDMLRRSLDGWMRLEDPVWGGFYRASLSLDWRTPEYEKLLSVQAQAIKIFAAAYQINQEESYRRAAERTIGFVRRFLKSTNFCYSSVDADLRRHDGSWVEGERYYHQSEAERMRLGYPSVDRIYYAGPNAELAEAYLSASVILKRPELKAEALRLLDFIKNRASDEKPREDATRELAVARTELVAHHATKDLEHLVRVRKRLASLPKSLSDPSAHPNVAAAAAVLYRDLMDRTNRSDVDAEFKRLSGWVAAHVDVVNPTLAGQLALRQAYSAPTELQQ